MSSVLFPYRVVLFQVLCCILLSIASNLSNKDDALCLRILQKHLQAVYEVCTVEWIPTNTLQETKQTLILHSSPSQGNSCEYFRIAWLFRLRVE